MKKRLAELFMWGGLIIIAVATCVVFFWNVQPTDVIKPNNEPYPVRPSINDPTGVEIVTLDYCKLLNIQGTVQIRFVGKQSMVTTARTPEKQDKGCQKTDVPILLPAQLMHDTFYIEFNAIYKINPITTVTETSHSQSFTIR